MNDFSIVWFRQDLRLDDNPAFYHANKLKLPVLPIYIWDSAADDDWRLGSASKICLYHSLIRLKRELNTIQSDLIILKGDSVSVINDLVKQYSVQHVFWNRQYEPSIIERDSKLKTHLKAYGVNVKSFNGSLLYEPVSILNKQGKPYKVYTAFWNMTQALPIPDAPLPRITTSHLPKRRPKTLTVKALNLLPTINWHQSIDDIWRFGEISAKQRLMSFLKTHIRQYDEQRDYPAAHGVSNLSPYLHFGELSPNSIWHAIIEEFKGSAIPEAVRVYQKQLVWREFAHYLLFHFPHTATEPLRDEFNYFPWQENKHYLLAWQRGETGYPIIDAGMRELWQTGFMHNRVRMIVASFLIKDCLIHWRKGAEWFWDTLVDANLANNTLGWQWVAGSGADAAPYFRIFNPVTQGERFDPDGHYIKKWLPELSGLQTSFIHKPWQAGSMALKVEGISLGKTYPNPILDHATARQTALDALKQMKETASLLRTE